jgi:hypothetical protein
MSGMNIKYEDTYYQYLSDTFMGVEMIFRRNKQTGELLIHMTDEIAQKIFGFENMDKMMRDERVQQLIQEFHMKYKEPLFKSSINFGIYNSN